MDRRPSGPERGVALLAVVLVLFAIGGSSATFVTLMSRQQAAAGMRSRTLAAAVLAEAGIHRALAVLEAPAALSGTGRGWRPMEYSETLSAGILPGRFTVSVTDQADGAVLITSAAEVGGVARRLRARVYLASPALLVALYAPGMVQLQGPPARTFILPYGAGVGDRPWVHIATARELWFPRSDILLNHPTSIPEFGPGPADGLGTPASLKGVGRSDPVRVLLTRDAALTIGRPNARVDDQQLQAMGVQIREMRLPALQSLPPLPEVDRAYFRARAAANTANAALNAAAGTVAGNADLIHKPDSLYSAQEFDQIQAYLSALAVPPPLRGPVYVQGALLLGDGQRLHLVDGALVVEGAVYLSHRSVLEVVHTQATRTQPGLIALDRSTLVVTEGAVLRVHGLLYATRTLAVDDGARVDVVGAVLTGDPVLSFRNSGGLVVVRYDPAVMGTPGLRLPPDAPVVAWAAAWEELP